MPNGDAPGIRTQGAGVTFRDEQTGISITTHSSGWERKEPDRSEKGNFTGGMAIAHSELGKIQISAGTRPLPGVFKDVPDQVIRETFTREYADVRDFSRTNLRIGGYPAVLVEFTGRFRGGPLVTRDYNCTLVKDNGYPLMIYGVTSPGIADSFRRELMSILNSLTFDVSDDSRETTKNPGFSAQQLLMMASKEYDEVVKRFMIFISIVAIIICFILFLILNRSFGLSVTWSLGILVLIAFGVLMAGGDPMWRNFYDYCRVPIRKKYKPQFDRMISERKLTSAELNELIQTGHRRFDGMFL